MSDTDWYTRIDGEHFDRAGRPISPKEWGRLRYGPPEDYFVIGNSVIRRWVVSTVWVGRDMGFGRNQAPVIFETAITEWGKRGRLLPFRPVGPTWRYSTEREARRGHSEMCRMIHSGWRG